MTLLPSSMRLSILALSLLAARGVAFEHFITRVGDKLYDGPAEFKSHIMNQATSGNSERVNFDWRENYRFRLNNDYELEQMVMAAKESGSKILRWDHLGCEMSSFNNVYSDYSCAYRENRTSATLNEAYYRMLDRLLQLCDAQGIRVIFSIMHHHRGGWGPPGTDGFAGMCDLLNQTANRINTITGRPYKQEKAIFAWSLINEVDYGDQEDIGYVNQLAAYMKGIDPNHLIIDSYSRMTSCYPWRHLDDPNMDILCAHTYRPLDGKTAEESVRVLRELTKSKKVLMMGELDPSHSQSTTKSILDTIRTCGAAGGGHWSWRGRKREGGLNHWNSSRWGGYDDLHWPGFVSKFDGVEEEKGRIDDHVAAQFELIGGSRPALTSPGQPRLLPIKDPGHISWQGSVNQQLTQIERSSDRANWQVLKSDYEDFLVSNQPLFCDPDTEVGKTYSYRVRAVNTSGISAPSNAVSVTVANRWLVDEMFDYAKMRSHSDATVIERSYAQARFTCDLAVLSATEDNQRIDYETPDTVNKIIVFAHGNTDTLVVRGSADGTRFGAGIALHRLLLPRLMDQFLDRVIYESSDLTAEALRYIRIEFQPGDHLGRVEIAHSGAAAPAADDIIIDNTDPEFSTNGTWLASAAVPGFIGTNYLQDGDRGAGGDKWAKWSLPTLVAGKYQVFMRWTTDTHLDRPEAATVAIKHAGGTATRTVNQNKNPGAWNLVGEWSFAGRANGDFVLIKNDGRGSMIADSIRLVKMEQSN